MPALPLIRALAAAGCVLALAAPAVAADDANGVVATALTQLEQADSREARDSAVRSVLAQGNHALPELTRRLASATADDERIELTYLLALIFTQARVKALPIEAPPDLVTVIATRLDAAEDLQLQANLANLAGSLARQGTDTTALAPPLLALLARTANPGLQATTSAVIATNTAALPHIHNALRQSQDDRFRGDLARVLQGTPLPDEVVAELTTLLESDHPPARQAAARTLKAAGISNPKLLEAALRDLTAARTDMQLLSAVSAVRANQDGSVRTAQALRAALDKAKRIEERREIAVTLAAGGEPGRAALLDYLEKTDNVHAAEDLVMTLTYDMRDDPRTPAVLVGLMARSDDERLNRLVDIRLLDHPNRARVALEQALAQEALDAPARERLTGALRILPV